MNVSSLRKTRYGNTRNIQENIIAEGAYLQKYDFKRKGLRRTVMRITGGVFWTRFCRPANLVCDVELVLFVSIHPRLSPMARADVERLRIDCPAMGLSVFDI